MSKSNCIVSVVNKPDDISFDVLYQIIEKAHEENRANGLKINTKISNGEQLKQHLGSNASIYVAFVDGATAGTVSVRMEEGQGVFTQGKRMAYLMHLAVLPEYKGCCVGRKLCEQVEKYAHDKGADAIGLHVVNKNLARGFYKHLGYEQSDFLARISQKQNTVYMVKWLKKSKTPWLIRRLYFFVRKAYITMKYRFN